MQCIPAACTGPIYTPWVRWPALGLGKFLWWKEKMVIRTASIVLHFVDGRGIMMDWWINTLNASQLSARNILKHHWWVCPCLIWYNSMIGMRKLSGCKCRNMWQLIGGNKMVDYSCLYTWWNLARCTGAIITPWARYSELWFGQLCRWREKLMMLGGELTV